MTSADPRRGLPRLLYIADVPIENTFHGSAVLFRLLTTYPAERLRLIETRLQSDQKKRLRNVDYRYIPLNLQRLLSTRFSKLASASLSLSGGLTLRSIGRACGNFCPEAVLTVAHGYGWQAAARFARHLNVPLHMIIHDNWSDTFDAPAIIKGHLEKRFGNYYRQAKSRLVISERMAIEYKSIYHASATVLPPPRALEAERYDDPSPRLKAPNQIFTMGYAGTVHGANHISSLNAIADALDEFGAILELFGPASEAQLRAAGLIGRNVRIRGVIRQADLLSVWRRDLDCLVVAVPFSTSHLRQMELNFPSKLTEYTASGLPILIYGPRTSSAVDWGLRNQGAAIVISSQNRDELVKQIGILIANSELRVQLATKAVEAGRRLFDPVVIDGMFHAALAMR